MLSLTLSEVNNKDLRRQLLEHGLIHIKCENPLSLEEFKNINLGKALIAKRHTLDEERNVQYVSDKGLFSNDDVDWHNDWSYGAGNYFGTMLYNHKNGHLSTTDFVDMRDAYLRYENKDYLRHTTGEYFPPQDLHESCFTPRMLKILEKTKVARQFAHVHHETGDTVMYFSPGTLQTDIDVSELIAHCEEKIYEHHWQDNDILIYDNIRYMHRRHAFEGERELWRTQFWI